MTVHVNRVKRDATEWAVITTDKNGNKGTVCTYKFDHYDPQGKRDWDEKRDKAKEAAFKAYRLWIDQPCMSDLKVELIQK